MENKIEIHRRSGSTYQLDQTLIFPEFIYGLALSEDQKELLACSYDFNIYRYNGTMFVPNQSIAVGFLCQRVKYIGSFAIIHGFSSGIQFYEFDGSLYVLKFTISTGETGIYESVVYDSGGKLMIGGFSKNISTYALKEDGSYALSEQLETGLAIHKLYMDPRKLYLIRRLLLYGIFYINCTTCLVRNWIYS